MRFEMPFHLNIRQKVVVGMTICVLAVGLIGGMSYHYLVNIEKKLRILEVAEELSNTILEMRRYEKNFLLYRLPEALDENEYYVRYGLGLADDILDEANRLEGASRIRKLKTELIAYQRAVGELRRQTTPESNSEIQHLEEPLRERGKVIVDLSQEIVHFERGRILTILKTLKTQLLVSLTVLFIFGGCLIPFVGHKIVRPLRVIETSTNQIAQGNFQALPVLKTRDETQRVVEAFNRMIKELEKRQNQLVEARKLSSLGVLTSGVAHQLNNPLNNISTSCQILLEELEEADMELLRKMLKNIEQEVNRARDIVKGLLEFSRVKEFSLVPTPLRDVVERCIRLISSQIPPGVEIVCEIPPDLYLDIDSQRMQQVFLNLLMNSIHAIKEPPGKITVGVDVDEKTGHAVIEVEDNGMGIPGEVLGKIFDPFFTTKEVGEGTGLGLSIVYGIIQKHRGSISVKSCVGEGSKFLIQLPLEHTSKDKGATA